ncbi:tudor domain-containing protein 3 [Schistocerca americana]|uniref:tudor domain-containing protein 3 n=1 Tax=Schistocerca americana TaxID=7009 RepID=UPI001F503EBE|nr:tudor domain-containing protein 3 [Schistocerca americana]
MAVTEALKERGWNLSEEAVGQITDNGSITDVKQIIQKALDIDLREISTSGFPEDLNKTKYETIPGSFVVQIQKIRNISAPKANEDSKAAPRMLKLSLTDGQISCQAVEVEYMPRISLDTPPGTKLFFKGDQLPMSHGYLLLRPSLIEVLGGKVPHLVEKWELNRTLAKHTRGRVGEEGGPPPWIPFGQKILKPNHQDRNFKSLETAKEKENRENAEFEAQRKDAIAEAARGGAKKIFGGGNKPLLDHNVQQIVDYGFTVEQAEYALRQNRNNVQRALKVLQRRADGQRRDDSGRERPRSEGKGKGGDERERKKRGERGGEEDGGAPPKPSGKVQLFAFLEDKLPVSSEKESEHRNASNISNNTGSNTSGGNVMTSNNINPDKKQFGTDMTNKANSNSRTSRTDRPNYSQSRNNGSRGGNVSGGGNSGGSRSNRGSRGANNTANNMTWSNGSDARSGGNFSSNASARDSDRGRHSSSAGNSGSTLQQQKPPRFQNQQRFQQQQQHQQPPQSQQLNDNFYGQPWANSYPETQYNTNTWSSKNSVPNSSNSKIRDDYVNHETFSSLGYEMNKNRSRSNNAGAGGFGMNFEPDTDSRILGNRLERMSNTRNYPPQQDILNSKFGTLPQSGIGHDTYSSYTSPPPPPRIQQTQQLYGGAEFTAYKDPVQPAVSNNVHNSTGSNYSNPGQGMYSSPSNHYIADNKVWRWQKGDKCMAKYWEDNVYYNAEVTGVSDRTCVVRFVEYGNYEEVLQDDCIPITDEGLGQSIQSSSAFSSSSDSLPPQNNQNHFSGILEFRRGGTRPYIKSAGADRKPPRIQQQLYMPPAQRK